MSVTNMLFWSATARRGVDKKNGDFSIVGNSTDILYPRGQKFECIMKICVIGFQEKLFYFVHFLFSLYLSLLSLARAVLELLPLQ